MVSPAEGRLSTVEKNVVTDPVQQQPTTSRWKRLFGGKSTEDPESGEEQNYRAKSTLGILSDKQTDEVPGKLRVDLSTTL
jgi:hypothetical protein